MVSAPPCGLRIIIALFAELRGYDLLRVLSLKGSAFVLLNLFRRATQRVRVSAERGAASRHARRACHATPPTSNPS